MKTAIYIITLIFMTFITPQSLLANEGSSLEKSDPIELQEDANNTRYLAKLGVGIPGLVQAGIEAFINDNYTLEGGIGKAPINMVYTAIARWRPEKTRFKDDKYHLAFGLEVNFLPEADLWKRAMWMGGPFADFHYQKKLEKSQAWVVGLRTTWGLGYKYNPPWKEEGYMAKSTDTGEMIAQDNSEFYPFIPVFSLYAGYKF